MVVFIQPEWASAAMNPTHSGQIQAAEQYRGWFTQHFPFTLSLQLITSATNVTTCEAWWEALQICNGFWKPLGMYFNELRKKRVTKMFYFSLIGLKGRWFLIALPIHVLTILRIILTSTYKNDPFIHGCGGGMVVGIGVSVFTYTLSWSIKYHLNHNIKLKL